MKLAIVDIETTGFYRKYNESIVELAIVLCDTKTKTTEVLFNKVLKDSNFGTNEKHKEAWIFKNSSLTYDEVESSKNIEAYRDEIQAIFDKYKITAFNKEFDTRWLGELDFTFKDDKCLMEITMEYRTILVGDPNKISVENTYRWLKNKPEYIEEHRALADALDEAEILFLLTENLKDDDFKSKLILLREEKKTNPTPVVKEEFPRKIHIQNTKESKEIDKLKNDPNNFEDKYDVEVDELEEILKDNNLTFTNDNVRGYFIIPYKFSKYYYYYRSGRWGATKNDDAPSVYYYSKGLDDFITRYIKTK